MHRSLLSAVLSLSVLLSTLVAAHAASYTFETIDVPGFRWTVAGGLNGAGDIVGSYLDAEGGQHGFLDNGTSMVTFDVPGARYTVPHGINTQGVIVGQYTDSLGVHGFVTADRVNFTTINYPGAIETFAFAINDHGAIVGSLTLSWIGGRGFILMNGEFTPYG
jgi:uncharacterized membrane protein